MKYNSVFEIIGPVMVGPSSSHTAGAVAIGRIARRIFGELPTAADIHFYGSFAETYKGHATDVAVVGGLLDFATDDGRIVDSLALAAEAGMAVQFFKEAAVPVHPNTVKIDLRAGNESMSITGISVGGGAIQITELDGFDLRLTGECPAVLIPHRDTYGMVAAITGMLAAHRINIGHMEVSRKERGDVALMVIETDQPIGDDLLKALGQVPDVLRAIVLKV